MANTYDINQLQGSSLSIRFTTKDSAGNNINITDYTVTGYVKEQFTSSNVLLNLNANVYSAVSGMVDIFVSGSVTANMPIGRFPYNVEAHGPSGTVLKISRGYMYVDPEVVY